MFHTDGKNAFAQAGLDHLFTMLRQINRGAADHRFQGFALSGAGHLVLPISILAG